MESRGACSHAADVPNEDAAESSPLANETETEVRNPGPDELMVQPC